MHQELSLKETQKQWHGSFKSYLIGFTASLFLTALSFCLVLAEMITGPALVYSLVTLAILQAIIQLRFFLHLGQEAKPKWESLIFYFMVLVLLIIAFGSLWIMRDLNDRVMSYMPKDMSND